MRTLALLAVLSTLGTPMLSAQNAPSATAPAASQAAVPSNIVSPEVLPDRTVTFRILAPNAKKVTVTVEGDGKPMEMQQGADGVWTVTTAAKQPDFYGYAFAVDGQRMLDPRNANVRPNLLNPSTVVHVPADAPQPWDLQDIPHGEVTHVLYRSKLVKADETDTGDRDMWVYTPPNYDPKRKEKYPVLYLNHGYSDAANGWVEAGQANLILDALLHEGKIKPMVVVMPLGYGEMKILSSGWKHVGAWLWENQQIFADQLLHEIMPMAEARWNIARDANHRAIAGLSMGGGHSIYTGLNHPETFAYVGAFSSAILAPALQIPVSGSAGDEAAWAKGFEQIVPHAKTQQPVKLFWMSVGADDALMPANRAFGNWAKANVKGSVQTRETPGMHTWMVWRDDLVDFAPLLFR